MFGVFLLFAMGAEEGLSLLRSGDWGLEALLSVPAPALSETRRNGNAYLTVRYESIEHEFTNEAGLPQLPVFRRIIEVPAGANVQVSIDVQAEGSMSVEREVIPLQPPVPKSGPPPAFVMDKKFYSTDEFWPSEHIKVERVGNMHGHELWLLEVMPVSYNPVRGELRYITSGTLKIIFTGGAGFREDKTPMGELVSKIAWNRPSVKAVPPLDIGYLIIVPDTMYNTVLPLANWKREKGYRVKVAKTSETGTSTTSIKNYIQNLYNNWEYDLQFVLLIGDHGNGVPGWPGNYANTDLYYACLENMGDPDYVPDVWIGRLSAASNSQLSAVISKILTYETVNWPTSAWAQKAYFMASDDPNWHQVAEGTHLYCMAKARSHGMICDSLWDYYGTGTPITTAINGGRSQATYSGHGYSTGWAGPSFSNSEVYALSNGHMLPLIQSYACETGDYQGTDECFMEAWIRAPNRGAIASWGSSVTSYWDEDDILQRRVYDWLFDSTVTWMMGFLTGGKMGLLAYYGNTSTIHRYFEQYNLFGDPSTDIFTLVPKEIDASYAPIPPGPSVMNVYVSDDQGALKDALVCVWQKDRNSGDTIAIIGVAYSNASGLAAVSVNPIAVDTVFVTATAYNHKPHRGFTLVISNEPYVVPVRYRLDDGAGNGDTIPNPGETVDLYYTFKNFGSQPAYGVEAKLRETDPNITLTDSVSNIGNLPPGDSTVSTDKFTFSSVPGLPDAYQAQFSMVITDNAAHQWTFPVRILLGTPVFEIASILVDDQGQPKPNYKLDPGETAKLFIELRDIGHGHGYGVTGTLRTTHSLVSISDSTGAWGDIRVNQSASNLGDWFVVTADPSIPIEDTIRFTLITRTVDGYADTLSFYLVVGEITEHDPIGPDPYGYYAYDQTDTLYTECPSYNWFEISGIGTELNLDDDDIATLALPFTFKYYGTNYSQVSVCSNGFAIMGSSTNTAWTNEQLPSSNAYKMIAGLWDDLAPYYGGGGGYVYYYNDAAGHQFIVEWYQVEDYSTGSPNTFQIVLSDPAYNPTITGDGEIFCYYQAAPSVADGTLGIQDNNMTNYLLYAYNNNYSRGAAPVEPPFALKYTTDPPVIQGTEETASLPKAFGFALAGPNPAKGTARFSLSVPVSTRVSVNVYDVSGRRVATLMDGKREPGVYTILWSGRSSAGTQVGQGVYLIRAEAGDFVRTLKILWLR
ncbi:MAG: C25 family cysteine peptidase [candidate division WOR-3 bacterium]